MSADMWRLRSAIVRKAWALEIVASKLGRRRIGGVGWITNPVARALGIEERAGDIVRGVDGKAKLLFWSEEDPPHRFIRPDVPPADRARVIEALRAGREVTTYLGFANCRICRAVLGSADLLVCDMVYPQKAHHYLSEHDVWTPECDELLRRLDAGARL